MSVRRELDRLPTIVVFGLTLVSCLLVGCNTLKNVPQEEKLLDKVTFKVVDPPSDISDEELSIYVRQQPNTKLLGLFRFNLWLYNLGKVGKETGMSGWFRRIGDPPVIFDEGQALRSVQNIRSYLNSRGFYHAEVRYESKPHGKRRQAVEYLVTYNRPTLIDTFRTLLYDSILTPLYMRYQSESLISPRHRLDSKVLERERQRWEQIFRDNGFYNFTADQIGFLVDTIGSPYRARLTLRLPNDTLQARQRSAMQRYILDSLQIYTRYDPLYPTTGNKDSLQVRPHDGLYYYFPKSPGIRLSTLSPLLLVRRDSLLRVSQINKSQQNLLNLGLFQNASFQLRPSNSSPRPYGTDTAAHYYPVNCDVRLTRFKLHDYQLGGFLTTSGSLGTEGSLTYRHRNLFLGAEQLEIQFRAQAEAILKKTAIGFKTALDLGLRVSIAFPRFLLPFRSKEFVRRYAPITRFLASYNFQRRPYYRRTVVTTYLSYNWNGSSQTSHSIIPLEVDFIKIFAIDPVFSERIRQTYLANSYISQIIPLTSYSFSYASADKRAIFSTTLLRCNIEFAGNGLNLLGRPLKFQKKDGVYQIFGLPFAQYVKGEINYSVLYRPNRYHSLANRVFLGIGYPYGNSRALPFEKRFYEGGANGVRAWHARDLGPGSYKDTHFAFPNQTGDLKFELNFEYRSWFFWKFESALFLDMGNIWAIHQADERPGAVFAWDRFYKEIAIGYGIGLRLNLGFFLIRLDMGVKLYDPSIVEGSANAHWIPIERDYESSDMTLHFGVGYPF